MDLIHLEHIKGDTLSLSINVVDNAGAAVDITGAIITFTAKSSANATTTVLSQSVSAHVNPTAGISLITVSAADMNIASGSYVYDIQLRMASGSVSTIARGLLTILKDVTNA